MTYGSGVGFWMKGKLGILHNYFNAVTTASKSAGELLNSALVAGEPGIGDRIIGEPVQDLPWATYANLFANEWSAERQQSDPRSGRRVIGARLLRGHTLDTRSALTPHGRQVGSFGPQTALARTLKVRGLPLV